MSNRVQRYLELYARLDVISEEEESAALVDEMQREWDEMSPAQRERAREAREARGRLKRGR